MLQLPNTRKHRPLVAEDVYVGGFDAVYDCIGTDTSLKDSISMARERGKITLVGCAGEINKLDWSFIWANELSILGTHAYAKKESWQGEEISTQALLMKLLEENQAYPLEQLITHEFNLKEYKQAIVANIDREKYQSIKTLFRF